MSNERRRSPRLATTNHPGFPPAVLDVSLGGMAVELPSALPTGAIHDIALQVGDGPEMVLRMRVSYSRRERRKNRARVYVTGLAFLADVTDRVSESLRLAS